MKGIIIFLSMLLFVGCAATSNRIPDGKTEADWEVDEKYCYEKSGRITGFWAANPIGVAINAAGPNKRFENCLRELGWIK